GSPGPDTGDFQWRIEKRNNTDGTLIPNFGTDGVVLENPSVRSDKAEGVGIDKSSIYTVGFDASPDTGNWQWRIEKRYMYTANFSIDIDPPSIAITQGDSGTSTIITTSLYGFTQPIDLSYSWEGDTPNNITVNLPTPIIPPSDETITSELEILAGDTASLGNFNLNITFESGELIYTLLVPVKITQSITPPGGCIIVSAAFNSPWRSEVVYMRHVRDDMIGSTTIGKSLINGWNTFYYSWSPPIAKSIAAHEPTQPLFQVLLLPLLGIIHVTAQIYALLATFNPSFASITAFTFAASCSTMTYIGFPSLTLLITYQKILKKKNHIFTQE
ncbi:MAG: CFI-box-CTERM domain-containing protein, partial [Candidatus Bathyarchaeia archaeon]